MRKLFTLLVALLLTASVFAQAPEKMNYQAVIRNTGGTLVTSTQIGMEINIRQGSPTGTVVYTETQTPTTNANGLVSIEIGSGAGFITINWGASTYFIETKTAVVAPLTTYTITGVSQLLSVPYALNAKTADNGITAQQASDITTNNAKVGITTAQAAAITTNTSAISTLQSEQTTQNTAIALNTAKVGITVQQASDITTNNAKVGITTAQANAITANTAKKGEVDGTQVGQMKYWNGSAWITVAPGSTGQVLTNVSGIPTWKLIEGKTDVSNPTTGKIWMDRNLGASQVATSSTDAASYGDLYQWGRGTDGHQIRTSGTIATLSTTDVPGHGNFITNGSSPYDWRSPQNGSLWQGVSGTNNPCPSGYRLPTEAELNAERLSWSSNNSVGAFGSTLKLPVAGFRGDSNGSLYTVGSDGFYWSSTVTGTNARSLFFGSSSAGMISNGRAYGNSVRCLKD